MFIIHLLKIVKSVLTKGLTAVYNRYQYKTEIKAVMEIRYGRSEQREPSVGVRRRHRSYV